MTEMMLNLLFLVCGALGWAYVTAQIVDIIVNANPDATAFKNRMDDLNRYVSFYELKPDVAQRLRTFTRRGTRARQSAAGDRLRAVDRPAGGDHVARQQQVAVHRRLLPWDDHPRGRRRRAARRAPSSPRSPSPSSRPCTLRSSGRRPDGCTSSTRKRAVQRPLRSNGFSWGALDVMLPNAPLVKRAVATTYLHVLWVDGPTLRSIAEDFPTTRRSLQPGRSSTGCAMLDQLGKAATAIGEGRSG